VGLDWFVVFVFHENSFFIPLDEKPRAYISTAIQPLSVP